MNLRHRDALMVGKDRACTTARSYGDKSPQPRIMLWLDFEIRNESRQHRERRWDVIRRSLRCHLRILASIPPSRNSRSCFIAAALSSLARRR